MVAVAIFVGLAAAMTVAPPDELPSVALSAPVVFRIEVGAAVFSGLYLASMAFVLALHNRGFTEIGAGGIRAQDLTALSDALISDGESQEDILTAIFDEINELSVRQEGGQVVN
jgi:hypothetical protein